MDDDGNKSLSYAEFKKGIYDYGLNIEEDVCSYAAYYYCPSAGVVCLVAMDTGWYGKGSSTTFTQIFYTANSIDV